MLASGWDQMPVCCVVNKRCFVLPFCKLTCWTSEYPVKNVVVNPVPSVQFDIVIRVGPNNPNGLWFGTVMKKHVLSLLVTPGDVEVSAYTPIPFLQYNGSNFKGGTRRPNNEMNNQFVILFTLHCWEGTETGHNDITRSMQLEILLDDPGSFDQEARC